MKKEDFKKNIKNITASVLLLGVLVLISMYFDGKRILEEGEGSINENTQAIYKELKPEVFNSIIQIKDENNFFLLNAGSSESENLDKTDAFISYTNLIEQKSKLPKDLKTRIVVYSQDGKMSQIAAKKLILLGYSDVFELQGGVDALKEKGLLIK